MLEFEESCNLIGLEDFGPELKRKIFLDTGFPVWNQEVQRLLFKKKFEKL